MKIGKTFKKLIGNKDKGRKVGADPPPGGTELEDLLDEIGDLGELEGEVAGEGEMEVGIEAGGINERLESRLTETDDKLGRIEQGLSSAQKDSEKIRGEITELQDNIRKLLSIYEIVYKDINPFIEDDDNVLDIPPPMEDGELPAPLELDGEAGYGPEPLGGSGGADAAIPPISVEFVSERGITDEVVGTVKGLLDEGNYEDAFRLLKTGIEVGEGGPSDSQGTDGVDDRETRTKGLLGRDDRGPILKEIPVDYLSNVTLMRWLEFLLERMPRKKVPLVLEYYVSNSWISKEVKYKIVGFLRGEIGGVTPPPPPRHDMPAAVHSPPRPPFSHMPELKPMEESFEGWGESPPPPYGSNGMNGSSGMNGFNGKRSHYSGWRLSAEDHLKSLLFINMIAGKSI